MFKTALAIFAIGFAIFGFLKGMILQIFSLSGLGLAFFLAPALGDFVIDTLKALTHWPFLYGQFPRSLSILIVGTLIYSVVTGLGIKLHRNHIKKSAALRGMDRLLGAILGGITGMAIVYLIATLF